MLIYPGLMDHSRAAALASKVHRRLERLHSMIYFGPEAEAELVKAGLRPGRMTYFASRAAPMGEVGPATGGGHLLQLQSRVGCQVHSTGVDVGEGLRRRRGAVSCGGRGDAHQARRRRRLRRDVGGRRTRTRSCLGRVPPPGGRRMPPTRTWIGRRSRIWSSGMPSHCCASFGATVIPLRSSRTAWTACPPW